MRLTSRASIGHSDRGSSGRAIAQRIKVRRDNRLILPRLISTAVFGTIDVSSSSWGWSRSQGFGCSPIKVVRELGSERRGHSVPICYACRRGRDDLVREDRVEHTTGGPVVAPAAVPVAKYGRDNC